jgi:uncharacterized membrane protein
LHFVPSPSLFKGLRIPICNPLIALVRKQAAASNGINYYYLVSKSVFLSDKNNFQLYASGCVMVLLMLGLSIFFMIHFIPELNGRKYFVDKMGEPAYKGLYSLLSIVGFVLLVYGKGNSDFVAIWNPPVWTRHVAMLLVLVAMLLLSISQLPNNFKRAIKHPMLLSVTVWGSAHLLANGDLASMILFGSFVVFSVTKMITMEKHRPYVQPKSVKSYWNLVSIVVGFMIYGLAMAFHRSIAGVPLF